MSPIAKISGWPGTVRSGSTSKRPARSAGAPAIRPPGEACTPAAQRMVLAGSSCAEDDAIDGASVTAARARASTPSPPARAGIVGEFRGKTRETRGPASTSTTRVLWVSMLRNSGGSVSLGEFGDGAGHFDAGRAGADDDEGQQRRAPRRVGFALGALEGDAECAVGSWWRPPASSGPARTAPIRRGRNRRGARRWRAPACHRPAHRRRRAARACPRHRPR